jgi:hypothetical protein
MSLDDRSDALDQKLTDNSIDASISTLVHDAGRRRRQIIWLAVSLVLDIFLTIGFGVLAVQARETSLATAKTQATLVSGCQTSNEFRRTEAGLWEHILSLQPIMTNLTPEQQAQRDKTIAEFQVYLKTTFAPRDCNNIIQK